MFTISFVFACKKKVDKNNDNSATIEKLQSRWTFLNYTTNNYYSNSDHLNTISGTAGDYLEFVSGGRLYLRLLSFTDTSTYSVISNNRIVFDNTDTFDIKTLTESQLVLYNKKVYPKGEYQEQTYNLQK